MMQHNAAGKVHQHSLACTVNGDKEMPCAEHAGCHCHTDTVSTKVAGLYGQCVHARPSQLNHIDSVADWGNKDIVLKQDAAPLERRSKKRVEAVAYEGHGVRSAPTCCVGSSPTASDQSGPVCRMA
eukprot:scaffold223_cov408-Prasinococcus_capsulatus_cf.AAC.10